MNNIKELTFNISGVELDKVNEFKAKEWQETKK
jgi:hypothetical protein